MDEKIRAVTTLGGELRAKVAELRRAGGSLAYIEGAVESGLDDAGEDLTCRLAEPDTYLEAVCECGHYRRLHLPPSGVDGGYGACALGCVAFCACEKFRPPTRSLLGGDDEPPQDRLTTHD